MTVRVENGYIAISFGGDPDELTLDEARELIADLGTAIAQAEQQQRDTEAACERDGHDWGPWLNGHAPFRNHARRCQRGCRFGYEQYPGWMPFAARLHRSPITGERLECCGPGCEWCDTEQFGVVVRGFLREAAARTDEFLNELEAS